MGPSRQANSPTDYWRRPWTLTSKFRILSETSKRTRALPRRVYAADE